MKKKYDIFDIEEKILKLCTTDERTSRFLSEKLNVNFNSMRSKFVYKLLKEKKLRCGSSSIQYLTVSKK